MRTFNLLQQTFIEEYFEEVHNTKKATIDPIDVPNIAISGEDEEEFDYISTNLITSGLVSKNIP